MQGNKRPWRVPQNRTARNRALGPVHILERRLIRGRDLHQREKAVERCARFSLLSRAKKLDGAIEKCPRLLWDLGRNSANLLELMHRAVRLTCSRQCIDELQPHRKICRRDSEYIS